MNQFGSDKIFKHLDRLQEWRDKGSSRPITYELDMTNVCNSKCPFCFGFNSKKENTASISLREARNIITQIKDFGGKGLTFTGGGDPLCNPATLEAVKFAKKKGLDIGFITNGIKLSEEAMDCLLDCCTWIRISLDAGTRETYKLTHGMNGRTFQRIVENIRMLVRKRRILQSNATIGTGFLTFEQTIGDMKNFVILSRDLGVDYAQFRPLLRKPGQEEINGRSDSRTLANINKCIKYSNSKFKVLCSVHKYEAMKNGRAHRSYKECHGHNFATVVSANMKMYLCCHMRGIDKYCIGDLKKNVLEEIWKSDRRKHVSKNIDFKDCPLLCRCDGFNNILWNICGRSEHENFL